MVGPSDSAFRDDSCDVETPLDVPLSAKYKRSFAYATIKERLPIIITKVVDYLCREKLKIIEEFGDGAKEDLKMAIGCFSKLRSELQTNKPLVPILNGSGTDRELWNMSLEELGGDEVRWFASPWLLVECYMYRRIKEVFESSSALTSFDPFGQQKRDAFNSSFPAIHALAIHLDSVLQTDKTDPRLEFCQLAKVSLWSNKCDLSISGGESNDQTLDPVQQLAVLEPNLLVNHLEEAWSILSRPSAEPKIIDLVLDNAGFELVADLCLAELLTARGLVQTVRLHVKAMPWFVSDVTGPDLTWTLQQLMARLPGLAERWQHLLDIGAWQLLPAHHFWTLPYDFSAMRKVAPDLFAVLSSSALIIYKGDLNYRKLMGDLNWRPNTDFAVAVRDAPRPLLALRTLKADVVTGLPPGVAEQRGATHPDWMVSGEFAVAQVVP